MNEVSLDHPPEARSVKTERDHWRKFAMVVAHDLKEPLRNVSSCARMLSTSDQNPEVDVQQLCGWLEDSAERVTAMIDALLDHARLGQESEEHELDLQQLVNEVVRDLRCLSTRMNGTVEAADLPVIKAGPLGLRIVMINLIENALKYGRTGVPIKISVTGSRHAEGWKIQVRDNGKGMTPTQVERIFLPFQRFNERHDGLGMGLTHVWNIIEGHGGWIRCTSEPGAGTTFTFFLPA